MRTFSILVCGFVLLGLAHVTVRRADGRSHLATILFLSVWGVICAVNAAAGINAGYSFAAEIFVFALTFLPPAILAGKRSKGSMFKIKF